MALFQVNVDLQRTAAISNNLITTVASFLKWNPEPHQVRLPVLTEIAFVRYCFLNAIFQGLFKSNFLKAGFQKRLYLAV